MSRPRQMPMHETQNTELNNLRSKHSLITRFCQFIYYRRKFFIKKLYEKCGLETSSRPFFISKESPVKKESEEVSVLMWTNFDSFANTFLV